MPINRRSIPLLSATGETMNIVSSGVKADSYYGYTDGLHTIQVQYSNFVGRVRIEATLSVEPTESDWFPLRLDTFTVDGRDAYRNYTALNKGDGSEAYTFQGNYTWLRIEIDRSHLGDGVTYDNEYGQVIQAILSA